MLYKELSECTLGPLLISRPIPYGPYEKLKLWTGPVDLRVRALLREYAANMSAIYGADTAAQLNDALRTANYSTRSVIAATEQDEADRAQALNEVDAITSIVDTVFSTAMRGDKNASIAEMTSHSFLLSDTDDYSKTVGQLGCPAYPPNQNYKNKLDDKYRKGALYYRHSVGCAGSLYKSRLIINLFELIKITENITGELKNKFNKLVDTNLGAAGDKSSYRQSRLDAMILLDSLRSSQRLHFEGLVLTRRLKEDLALNFDDDDDIRAIQAALAVPRGKPTGKPSDAQIAVSQLLENENDPRWYFQVDFQTATDCLHVLASTEDIAEKSKSAFCIGRFARDSNLLYEQTVNLEKSFRGISLTGQ